MLLPKTKTIRNKKHLIFVCSFKCCLNGLSACSGHIQAHHLLKPWYGHRGTGMRASDCNAIPLCNHHHTQLHDRGDEDAFWQSFDLSSDFGRKTAKSFWILFQEGDDDRQRIEY